MTSRQIAELTGKRHDHVMRDIKNMLEVLEKDVPSFGGIYLDSYGREKPCYELDEEHTLCLTSGYSVTQRMAIIREWKALKEQTAVVALPNFNNPVEAARAWANEVEAKQEAQLLLEQAKPSVEFVDNYVEASELLGFRQVSKLTGVKEPALRKFLVDSRIMYKLNGDWTAYQEHINSGMFETKVGVTTGRRSYVNCKFTTQGLTWITRKLQDAGLIS